MTQRLARRLHSRHRLVPALSRRTEGPGLGSWTLELPSSLARKLRKAHHKKVTLRLTATAVDEQHRRTSVARWFTFR